jgi:hypothetical protein
LALPQGVLAPAVLARQVATQTQIFEDSDMIKLAFPIVNIVRYAKKTKIISGDFDALMKAYHNKNDVPDNIQRHTLVAARKIILRFN